MALCLSGGGYRAMLQHQLDADPAVTTRLAEISARVDAMPEELPEPRINRPLSDASASGA